MNEFVFFINNVLIAGSVTGSIYAIGAVGVTLVFSIMRFAHFAHADMMTFGAFMVLLLATLFPHAGDVIGVPTAIVMLPLAMVLTAALAVGIDKAFYKPLRAHGVKPIVMVIGSLGVTLMLQGLIRLFSGTGGQSLYVDDRKEIFRLALPFEGARVPVVITEPQIYLFVLTLVAVIGLQLFLSRTRLGKAMRAMSDNPDLARASGINTNTIVAVTWVIVGGLAAIAGTLLSMDVTFKPDLSFHLLLPIFAAAIVGGVGHPFGAIAGGFVVGFAETLAVFNWRVLLRPFSDSLPEWLELPSNLAFVGTEYKIVVPFFILVAILVWRPTGIFKGKVI
ncbi:MULTISPECIES: branched-chain amino acid ABC transporter permease [unclassified Halomonas]|uniref:Branched-chain amino acid ABC transporter permease n=1 Tax=Halomonas sp. H10-59 TaxID=2950874 RepID=A0AAU7KT50_9GAMM|nr:MULTISPECIES: branched-chain amino acid ABC transporter permease [unclassified Halomonas]MBR9771739.1 branched-chain amino acid ABC transporter permease [Gammaproteobacteria bacterium]KJZ16529.1 branched-chain amino acid ABC transporter permease [Halomonas sp. S2151]MAR73533.1 branched-chain amino acid ABC transporter permease [Halomonas sp.]MAY72040.1 branched-chain amino acid ABC transporter permease [Halomonas sp.]MBY5940820.1 branched-chain amino acid ABC transporter permease [Halomonas